MFRRFGMALTCSAAALSLAAVVPAKATTVATIQGAYDKDGYDTPELDFFNTSGGTLTNAKMVLTGYQGLNNGNVQTVNLANMGAGQTDVVWGTTFGNAPNLSPPGSLTSYDYDDTYPGSNGTNSACIEGSFYCAVVGNFKVTYTATISGGTFDGQAVFAVFSPTTNATGGFVGWEGLDPNGLSETVYDAHSGSFSGTMANIDLGVPPVPEASTWAMMILGFAGVGFMAYRRKLAMMAT